MRHDPRCVTVGVTIRGISWRRLPEILIDAENTIDEGSLQIRCFRFLWFWGQRCSETPAPVLSLHDAATRLASKGRRGFIRTWGPSEAKPGRYAPPQPDFELFNFPLTGS